MFNRDKTWGSRGERNIPAHQLNPYSANFCASGKKSLHGVEQEEESCHKHTSLGFGRGNAVFSCPGASAFLSHALGSSSQPTAGV